jgi:hypothetical protein
MRQFNTAANRGKAAVPNAVDIQFQWDDAVLTAHPPSSGQLALLLSTMVDGQVNISAIAALFDFLNAVMDVDDFNIIRNDLQDGVDVGLVVELIEALIEEWAVRPTTPAIASSPSRRSTGSRSTVRPAATG